MIRSFLHKLFETGHSIGIDIEFFDRGKLRANLCLLKNTGGELRQTDVQEFDSYQQLFCYLKDAVQAPIYLNLRGVGVIQQVHHQEDKTIASGNLCKSSQRIDVIHLTALAREEFILSVIHRFTTEKHLVLGVHPGLYLSPVKSLIEKAQIGIDKNRLLNFENNRTTLQQISESDAEELQQGIHTKYGKLTIAQTCSLAAALSFFQPENANIQNLDLVHENNKTYTYRRRYHTILKLSVVFIFSLLLANYAAFDYYFSGNETLEQRIELSRSELLKVDRKKAELQTKKQFVAVNGLGVPSEMALYADQLALLLPVDTYFESLQLCPMQKSKRNEQISFDKTRIHVRARTNNTENINKYIEQIEKLDWVDRVSIESVTPKNKIEQLQFSLILKLISS